MRGRRRGREYRRFTLLGLAVTVVSWVVAVAVVGGLLVAAWPLVIAGAGGFVLAWWRGWPPRRLAAGAAWCLPMVAAFAVAYWARGGHAWQVAAWSPFLAWQRAWHALAGGAWVRAMVIIAPTAIPAGLLAAVCWRARVSMMAAGAAGWWPGAPVAYDERQWRRQMAAAGQRVRAPGGVPILARRGQPVLGAVIRAVGHRPRPLLALLYSALRTHMLVVGVKRSPCNGS